MSLETEIKNLTAAVIALTERMSANSYPVDLQPEFLLERTADAAQIKSVTAPTEQPVAHEAVKSRCLMLIRNSSNKAMRETVRELVASFGAKTVDALSQENLIKLNTALDGLA
jgi:acetolactate synthase small subunit